MIIAVWPRPGVISATNAAVRHRTEIALSACLGIAFDEGD
jgi:hypothetical protein